MERPLPKTLAALVKKKNYQVEEGHAEQDDWAGRGTWSYWLYLREGWCYPEPGSHIIHEHTVQEVRAALSRVAPCDCIECAHVPLR